MTDQRPTVPAPPPARLDGHQLWLMVITDDRVETHPLPPRGRVVLGRDASAGVCVDRDSVSRTHAALTIGAELRLEDLGSANGTHLAGRRLARGERADALLGATANLPLPRRAVDVAP